MLHVIFIHIYMEKLLTKLPISNQRRVEPLNKIIEWAVISKMTLETDFVKCVKNELILFIDIKELWLRHPIM